MLTLLRSPRWQAFTAAAVVAIVAFGLLSMWQWHRAEQKRAEYATVEQRILAAPVAAADVAPADSREWQHVTITGQYDPAPQYLVRSRPQNGSNGFWVLALLRSDNDSIWVARGWIPANVSSRSDVTAPPPPTGEATVDGYARNSEAEPARAADDLPAGQITAVNTSDLSQAAASTAADDWYVIADNDPTLIALAKPEPTDSRNLSYAGQWLLFAAIAIGGWFYFLRREAASPEAPAPDPMIEPEAVATNEHVV